MDKKKNSVHMNTSKNKKVKKFFDQYNNTIQGICSLFSAIAIGTLTIYLTVQANIISQKQLELTNKQTALQYKEQAVFIDGELDYTDKDNGIAEITLINSGGPIVDSFIEILTFFDIRCDENFDGAIPVRLPVTNTELESFKKDINSNPSAEKLASFKIYTDKNVKVHKIASEFLELSEHHIIAPYQTAIKIKTTNIADITEYHYFLIHGQEFQTSDSLDSKYIEKSISDIPVLEKLTEKQGEDIFSNSDYAGSQEYELGTFVFYLTLSLDDLTADDLLNNAVYLLRSKNLYVMENNKIRLYEGYEPDNNIH